MTQNEICQFEVFQQSTRQIRSIKKELEAALKRRASKSISNLRVPKEEGEGEKWRPSKWLPAFNESRSLKFDGAERKRIQKAAQRGDDYADSMLKNIKDLMEQKNLRLENFNPAIIAQINKFENLNDFDKAPEFYPKDQDVKKRVRRRAQSKKPNPNSIFAQFGQESSGQADLAAQ